MAFQQLYVCLFFVLFIIRPFCKLCVMSVLFLIAWWPCVAIRFATGASFIEADFLCFQFFYTAHPINFGVCGRGTSVFARERAEAWERVAVVFASKYIWGKGNAMGKGEESHLGVDTCMTPRHNPYEGFLYSNSHCRWGKGKAVS